MMKITGPEHYRLAINSTSYKLAEKFSRRACSHLPKLYVLSVNGSPIYIGKTVRRMSERLRYGFKADGRNGYHGYAWRHKFSEVQLDIWYHEDASADNAELDIETIEAEVVYLIRCAGQWPECQTEIHFHPSTKQHRDAAAAILGTYAKLPLRPRSG
jgi:hypothetical protein